MNPDLISTQKSFTTREFAQTIHLIKAARAQSNDSSCAAGTILLVEDEIFVREVICEVLRFAGYLVLAAKNAAEAIELYENHHCSVDILITDVVLPGETGLTLAKRLRKRDSPLKVLYITGYTEQKEIRETQDERCLPKPFSTESLLAMTGQLLSGKYFRR